MASKLRGGKNQMLVWALLGLLILGLTGFGIGGLGGGSLRTVGSVGEQPISVDVYARALNNSVQSASRSLGRALSPAEVESFGITRNVLSTVLSGAALDNEAKRMKISVGDEAVAADIRATPGFQGLDGTFDKEAYEFALENAQVSAAENEALIRQAAARSLVERAVVTGVTGPTTQAETLLGFARETRDFTWASIDESWLPPSDATPTEDALQTIYEANPADYTAPETREITYAWLTPEMLEESVTVDEALLQESYDLQTDRFNRPPRIDVDRIVFSSGEEAAAAKTAIDDGSKSFDAILEERALSAQDVSMGEVAESGLATEAAALLFAQEEPGVYGPAQSSLGPAIYRVNAIFAAENTPFEEAREELFAELAGEEARRIVSDLVVDIDDMLAAGATLEELANDTQMELGTISYTDASQGGIAGYAAFRQEAASIRPRDFPEVKDLSDGGIFALRLDELKQPALRPFDEVREQVVADWQAEQVLERLQVQADILVGQLESGTAYSSLQLDAQSELGVNRAGLLQGVPVDLVLDIFEAAEGDYLTVASEGQVYISKLDAINPFDSVEPANATLLEQVNAQLSDQQAADLLTLFSTALQAQAGVQLNQAALNQINVQITSGAPHGG